ncbi:MAG: hypothetical protein PVJ21_12485 [Anaerolineales bacterium]|jgi:hypothetical protein
MDKKTTGLIATIATALLCGCPGLIGLCMGAMFAFVGAIPGSDIDVMGSSDPTAAIGTGVAMLCLGVVFVAIPIVVGVVTLREPKVTTPAVVDVEPVAEPVVETTEPSEEPKPPAPPADDEPLPPAS